MVRKKLKYIVIIIIVFILVIVFVNIERKPEETIEKLFGYLNDGNIYKANMLFLSNYENRSKISKQYENNMLIGDLSEIGYNEYFPNEDYMIEYFKKTSYNITDINYGNEDNAIINIIISKPNYNKYISKSFSMNGEQSLKESTQKFINYINKDDVEYIKSTGFIYLKKTNNEWKIDYQDNMVELFY